MANRNDDFFTEDIGTANAPYRENRKLGQPRPKRPRPEMQRPRQEGMTRQRPDQRTQSRSMRPEQQAFVQGYGLSPEEEARQRRREAEKARRRREMSGDDYVNPVKGDRGDDPNGYEDMDPRMKDARPRKRKKKKHPVLRVVLILLSLILVLLVVAFVMFMRVAGKFKHIDTEVSKNRGSLGDQINIVLIGQDAREGEEQQRSDSIMLLTINKNNHTVVLTSFMRDLYIENIPGYGGNRINASFSFGGVDLLDQTIEENFGIKIDGNMFVDFDGFLQSMSALGSLDMDLSEEEANYMNENAGLGYATDDPDVEVAWNLHPGVNTLNASQLLCYSRMRHLGNSDYDRVDRQRKVIMAAFQKVKKNPFAGYKMMMKAAPSITTDLTKMNMLSCATGLLFEKGGIQSYRLPVEGAYEATYVDDMAVLVPDLEANKTYLQKYMSGTYKPESE